MLAVAFVLLFNPFGKSRKGQLENDFDGWLKASTENLTRPTDGKIPFLEIALKSNIPGRAFSWALKSSDDWKLNEKILRLLRQAREAKLFLIKREAPTDMVLEIKDENRHFVSTFNETDIKDNLKIAIFVKLFEEFIKDQSSPNSYTKSRL